MEISHRTREFHIPTAKSLSKRKKKKTNARTRAKNADSLPFNARVLRVMIASPSDVAAERRVVQAIIQDWNAVHSQEKRTVLYLLLGRLTRPLLWESAPRRS